MQLSSCIEQIQENLRRGLFQNEAAVSQGVILKVLNALGWDTYDTQIVAPEFSVGGRRVDFALCYPATKPAIFIEVKQVGRSDGADKQLFEYAFHEGIPLAILTDGREWSFYLPAGQGAYSERKFYFLDLLERDIDEICFRLDRYVSYARVKSGEARNNANNDYQFKGQWHPYRDGITVMIAILKEFAESDKTFLARFASKKQGRTRRWIDQNKKNLYPDQPLDFQDKHSQELVPGWWVGTNYSAKSDMPKIIESACEVMGIKFNSELKAKFRT